MSPQIQLHRIPIHHLHYIDEVAANLKYTVCEKAPATLQVSSSRQVAIVSRLNAIWEMPLERFPAIHGIYQNGNFFRPAYGSHHLHTLRQSLGMDCKIWPSIEYYLKAFPNSQEGQPTYFKGLVTITGITRPRRRRHKTAVHKRASYNKLFTVFMSTADSLARNSMTLHDSDDTQQLASRPSLVPVPTLFNQIRPSIATLGLPSFRSNQNERSSSALFQDPSVEDIQSRPLPCLDRHSIFQQQQLQRYASPQTQQFKEWTHSTSSTRRLEHGHFGGAVLFICHRAVSFLLPVPASSVLLMNC